MSKIALIGGTGLNRLEGLDIVREHEVQTPWGECSHRVQQGRFHDSDVFFLARHGVPHQIPPHRINYRANIWALRELGVTKIIGVNAVGGIERSWPPGFIALPDQLIDYTYGREHTFYDGSDGELQHIDFTEPYNPDLRQQLIAAAQQIGLKCSTTGTYAATQGPRLETAAEVRRLHQDGCDIVGMTGMPEAALAAELGLAYAAVCLVVNAAAGLGEEPITEAAMHDILDNKIGVIGELLGCWLANL